MIADQWHDMVRRTACCQGTCGAQSRVPFAHWSEKMAARMESWNEGIDRHKVDDEVCGCEWMV